MNIGCICQNRENRVLISQAYGLTKQKIFNILMLSYAFYFRIALFVLVEI